MNRYEKLNQEKLLQKKTFRVGAYCRVSTDNEDQANSFESQQRYFKEYINRNPEWQLTEIFADEGISGTNTKKRKAFNRMIDSAKNGDLDLIITKEISRFARNTLDSIYYTRELKKIGVGVIFMNDNINTLEPDAELRLTIMSSIAQEESRKTSERVKWGQTRRMEQGVVFGRDMLGYDVRGGEMFINEEGAKIVRLIFDKFVNENKGCHTIARELREAGIKSHSHQVSWSNTVILRIVRNEKYCGDLVQKKTYTPDYLSHEKKYNRGQEEFVVIKNHHEPIISREMFDRAGAILESRAVSPERKSKHSNRYAFSGKIKCARCETSYVARYKKRKDGSISKSWRCCESSKFGAPHIDKAGNQVGCDSESIRNNDALYIMGLVVDNLNFNKEVIVSNLMNVIKDVVSRSTDSIDIESLQAKINQTEEKQKKLIDLYTSGNITKEEFLEIRDKCSAEIQEHKELIGSVDKQNLLVAEQKNLIKDINDALTQMIAKSSHDEEFYRNILDKMVIHSRDHIDVHLKLLPHKWSYALEKLTEQ
ncbi:MAG: recombinase family protein [Lachnospiraceae bacterium]|nr:recombinase family protein [Lachnospiraceae bacterium]